MIEEKEVESRADDGQNCRAILTYCELCHNSSPSPKLSLEAVSYTHLTLPTKA